MSANMHGLLLVIAIFGGLLLLILIGYLFYFSYKKIKEKKTKNNLDRYFLDF
jgi:hypothetical protein